MPIREATCRLAGMSLRTFRFSLPVVNRRLSHRAWRVGARSESVSRAGEPATNKLLRRQHFKEAFYLLHAVSQIGPKLLAQLMEPIHT
jgi:hypothetical protein